MNTGQGTGESGSDNAAIVDAPKAIKDELKAVGEKISACADAVNALNDSADQLVDEQQATQQQTEASSESGQPHAATPKSVTLHTAMPHGEKAQAKRSACQSPDGSPSKRNKRAEAAPSPQVFKTFEQIDRETTMKAGMDENDDGFVNTNEVIDQFNLDN
ncbi:hypothetical protein KEM55_009013 [Ascosphaera atra]|nr:hypothetical protein KEM55_009013 [Ascosphaera atra]